MEKIVIKDAYENNLNILILEIPLNAFHLCNRVFWLWQIVFSF